MTFPLKDATTFTRGAVFAFTLLSLTTTLATAQTKTVGDGKCAKPDQQQSLDVGDRAGHALAIARVSCTWTNPWEMAGLKTKDYAVTAVDDVSGAKVQERGYVVVTMDNGDKAFVRYSGTSTTAKDGSTAGDGTWSYTGGTGKLKGLTGKGTYKSAGNADSATDHVEGDYMLPPPPAPKAGAAKK
jgi:hypothetical protein